MKNVILFALFSIIIEMSCSNKTPSEEIKKVEEIVVQNTDFNEAQVMAKVKNPNINEVLWLWHKYKIRKIRSHCMMTDAERQAQRDQESAIGLQHGNLFWGTVNNEVDSIERNDLGYKKAKLSDFDKYLKSKKCAIENKAIEDIQIAGAWVNLNLNAEGKIASFNLDSYGYPSIHFGREKCDEFNKYLTKVLTKAPLIKPSTFLNKGIEDRINQLYVMQIK
jgi:hypothetical protein